MTAEPPTSDARRQRNRARKLRQRRAKLRRQLNADGCTAELIDKILERQHFADLAAVHGEEHARRVLYGDLPEPDDSGYRPTHRDPLLHGPCRAVGPAATAARRRGTLRRTDHPDHKQDRST
jgi:hypothetical protein